MDYSKLINFPALLAKNTNVKTSDLKIKSKENISIIKYNKEYINNDNIDSLGLFRSIISDGKKILSNSPGKSYEYKNFITMYNFEDCIIEEFVEGTMLHCFYTDQWRIATRFCLDANSKFYRDKKKNFRELFLETMAIKNFNFDLLNKQYSYIFILQHPENRIVTPFDNANIVLLEIYENEGFISKKKNIYLEEFDELRNFMKTPKKINDC